MFLGCECKKIFYFLPFYKRSRPKIGLNLQNIQTSPIMDNVVEFKGFLLVFSQFRCFNL